VDSFHPQSVNWVQLVGGQWHKVDAASFELKPEREWSSPHSHFAYGFSFVSGGHRLAGPVASLLCVAIDRNPDQPSYKPPRDESAIDPLPQVTVYQTVSSQGLLK
jgi:hypothetical protein